MIFMCFLLISTVLSNRHADTSFVREDLPQSFRLLDRKRSGCDIWNPNPIAAYNLSDLMSVTHISVPLPMAEVVDPIARPSPSFLPTHDIAGC